MPKGTIEDQALKSDRKVKNYIFNQRLQNMLDTVMTKRAEELDK